MNESKQTPNFFDGRLLGASLKEISVDTLNVGSRTVVSKWFHGEKGADLYTWIDETRTVIKQQLSFYGQIVEWNCLDGLKTGMTLEEDTPLPKNEAADSPLSLSIKFDSQPQEFFVEQALEILKFIKIDERVKSELVLNFQTPKSIKSMDPESFVKRFGPGMLTKPKSSESIWEQLKTNLKSLFPKS